MNTPPRTQRFDLMVALDAVYAVEQAPERWLAQVVATLTPMLDWGEGGGAYFVDVSRADMPLYWGFVGSDEMRTAWLDWLPTTPIQVQVHAHRGMAFGTLRSVAPTLPGSTAVSIRSPDPYMDVLGINGVDDAGRGVALAFPARSVIRPPGDKLGRELAALSTHLARAAALVWPHAGHLGPRIHGVPDDEAEPRPSLGPLGLAALRELARRSLSEHEPLTPEETRVAWHDMELRRLVAIDHFEASGRRFTIAIHPRTDESRTAELTARELEAARLASEGLSNKLIADRMGVGVSTVGTLLSRAATKLGTESRVALVRARPHLERRRS